MEQRDIIIALLEQDIKHNRLLNGLQTIGFYDNDKHILELDLVVAKMMGYEELIIPDTWLDAYHHLMLKVTHDWTNKQVNEQAIILYETLTNVQR